jgi:AdoMet-dependent heme synthase
MNEPTTGTERPLLQKIISKCSQLNIPAQAVLEMTYRCNLHCAHCYVDLKENNELSVAEWQDIMAQLKAAGTMFLLFTGGEIMARDDFLEIASLAHRNGFIPGFITNCTMVTPEIAKAIAGLKPFSIATSLYGATAATHEQVTGVQGSFEGTLNGVQYLVDAGLKPIVQTLIMQSNMNELEEISTLVREIGAESHIKMGIAPSKSGDKFPLQYEAEGIEKPGFSRSRCLSGLEDDTGPGLCKAGRAMCSISPQGDVYPCPMFPLKLGSLRKSNFNSIWNTQPCGELKDIRSIQRSDLTECNTCQIKSHCNRCSGIAYLENGRANGVSPSACRRAKARFKLNHNNEEVNDVKQFI